MAEQTPTPLALALIYLRTAAAWSKSRLASALGFADSSLISHYERFVKTLSRENLDALVEPMAPPEAVDVLLFAHELIFPETQEMPPSPVALTSEEHRGVDRAAMAAGWSAGRIAAQKVRSELVKKRKLEKIEVARQEAEEMLQRLVPLTPQERSGLVEAFPEFWRWALAVRLCEASVKSAAHKVEESLRLADLALTIAGRVPGEASWRSRLEGFCWAHVANARRVANDHVGSERAFARAWELWKAGSNSDPELLEGWLMPAMEASLRRDQRRFPEALELLDRARACQGGEVPAANLLLLVQKEHVFNQMGVPERALEVLAEAAPLAEASENHQMKFSLLFSLADNFCQLNNYEQAAEMLPKVREMAVVQANDLDLIRFVWLESKVAAGLGRSEEAIACLEKVGRDFTMRKLPYDAALASLDLAVLWLKAGRQAEVRELANGMGWIFKNKGIGREAFAALKLFVDAAQQEAASVELTRRAIAAMEKARRSAPSFAGGRDRER